MASSTAYELGKSSWPSQILLVCRLGTGSASSETQTLTRSKPHPYGIEIRLNTPTRGSGQQIYYSSSRALGGHWTGCVCYPTIFRLSTRGSKLRVDLSLGRWIYYATLRINLSLALLQHQSTSEEKHGRLLKKGSGDCRTFLCSVSQTANGSRTEAGETTGPFFAVSVNS